MSRWSRRENDWDDDEFVDEVDDPQVDVQPADDASATSVRVDPWWVRDGATDDVDLGDPSREFDADTELAQDTPEFHEFEFVEPTPRSQRRVLAGVLAVVALVAMGVVGVLAKRTSIERDLRTHVEANYRQAGLGGLKVSANGRDLTATGVVASEDELKRAQELARAVRGVRRITLRATVESTVASTVPTPTVAPTEATAPTTTVVAVTLPEVALSVDGKKLTVIGTAPSAEARDAFLTRVSDPSAFGPDAVSANDLITNDTGKATVETWQRLGQLTAGVPQANIDNLAITIVDDVMTLAGIVDDPTVHDNLITAAQQVAGDPSHVIDETSGANRTVTTETPVVTEPSAPAISVPVTTPLTTPAVAPVTAAPVPTPRVTAAPRPTTARVSRSSRSTSSSRTSANRATATVAKASSAVKAVRTTKPIPTTTDGFVTQGGADVPDTTLVEEPPVAAPDAEADTAAASASTRDQVRAAIAGASIDFSEGSAELTDASRAVVGRIAAALVASTVRIEVRAYTDDRGDEQVNRALTQRRANVVRAELVAQGVDGARVSAAGLGAANSVASDDTADGRRRNRRVVFAIFGQ